MEFIHSAISIEAIMKKKIKSMDGSIDGLYEIANLDTIWKKYPFMNDNIRPMVEEMDIMVMDEGMMKYGGALTAQQENGRAVIFLPMEREDWIIVTGIVHEGIHGCQIKSGRLAETSEKNVTSWDGSLIKTIDFSEDQELLMSDPKIVKEYLNLPWEREAWIITAEYGKYILAEGIESRYMGNACMYDLSHVYKKSVKALADEAIRAFCRYRHRDS